MGLEIVEEEIIRNAEKNASSLLEEAKNQAGSIASKAEKKIEEMKQEAEKESKRRMETIKRQELSSAELENKKTLLEAKKEIIESVFAEAWKRVGAIDTKKREVYIKNLLEKIKKEIELEYIYCSKKDLKLLKGFKAEATDIIGGIMAENRDRTIKVDYSFDTILKDIKESELQTVNKILFG